jgi:multimeric flavodoxin WrbA
MKVILVNGSPHEHGTTSAALNEVASALNADGVETEVFWLGKSPLSGCMGCGGCAKTGRCVINDNVNAFLDKAESADGFIFGTPVHFASASGAITSFMDRAFYGRGKLFAYKPAAAVVVCRRGGASATFDVLNKYFTISNMPIVSSTYWNDVHGKSAAEAALDEEGMQTMRSLGHNMAWLLKCIDLGKASGISPVKEKKVYTNFIR